MRMTEGHQHLLPSYPLHDNHNQHDEPRRLPLSKNHLTNIRQPPLPQNYTFSLASEQPPASLSQNLASSLLAPSACNNLPHPPPAHVIQLPHLPGGFAYCFSFQPATDLILIRFRTSLVFMVSEHQVSSA